MDSAVITALSGLAGAMIGGLSSGLAMWLSQRSQAKAQWTAQNHLRRQDIYKTFIEQASKLYIEALQSDHPDLSALMALYAQSAGCAPYPRRPLSNAPIRSPSTSSRPISNR